MSATSTHSPPRVRFTERYRVKGHLSAGAHGVILWAVDRMAAEHEDESVDSNLNPNPNTFECNDGIRNNGPSQLFSYTLANRLQCTRQYAVKRVFIRCRNFPLTLVREIKVLQFLRGHPNIIELLDVAPSGSSVNLIFPLLPTNLTTLIYDGPMNSIQVAIYFRMLVQGLDHMHRSGIVHRDLKPSNLLIDWTGRLQICDFGQARALDICVEVNGQRSDLTSQVCTRWYRAPELLYGSTSYSYEVDLWSTGCILAEMTQRWPLFRGETDIEQLSLVVKALGPPPAEGDFTKSLPDYTKIQFFNTEEEEEEETTDDDGEADERSRDSTGSEQFDSPLRASSRRRWLEEFRQKCRPVSRCSDRLLDLLERLCRWTDRIGSDAVLRHPFVASLDDYDEATLARFYDRPRFIKHLSGPPRNTMESARG